MNLFENEAIAINLDMATPCLEWVGKKSLTSEEFRDSETRSLQFYQEYKDKYPGLQWFVDAREIEAISPQDTHWVVENILPQLASLGLKKEAFVVPKNMFGKLTVQNYIFDAGKSIEMQIFSSVDDAKKWLKE